MMFDPESVVLGSAALLTGPGPFVHGFRDYRDRHLTQNTPTARIRSMPMGLVEVRGTIEARSTMAAPFSGRSCVFWEVEIATQSRRGVWTTVHRNASGHPFFLRDDTGVALVYPQGAMCKLRQGLEEECLGISLPECYAQYMSDQNLALRALWRTGTMRFRERSLEPGQPLFVLGTAGPRAHAVAVSDDEPLAATGTDDARPNPIRELDHATVAVIRRGESERTFLLSEQSQRDLMLTLGLRSWAELLGGPILTLLGLGAWLWMLSAGGR